MSVTEAELDAISEEINRIKVKRVESLTTDERVALREVM